MKKIINLTHTVIYICLALCVFASCQDEDYISDNIDNSSSEDLSSTSNAVEGVVRIKLEEAQSSSLSVSLKSGSLSTSIGNIDSVLTSIGATSFKRTFPYAGKFEARTVKAGLHLWYDVKYDTSVVNLSSALSEFKELSEIDITEPIRTIKKLSVGEPVALSGTLKSTSSTTDYMFNDTYLSYQWHYYNDGTVTDAIAGADINLFDAWLKQTGSSDVIVSIVDGGLDTDHDDLADNMWINETEYNGTTGVDDDNNGYTDDIYGYNFVSESGTIVNHTHGCHVGGTVSAVNNNGTGVCGIAGGDGTNSGVQIMSCQVFQEDEDGDDESADDFAAAIKYGADNGAVISQNSWGYDGATDLPLAMQDAIDYFIEYAGYDENGNQTGPMAGGVVIFAAGNDESSTNAYPAMYDAVIAVAACNPDYTMSYYSNYGSWVDITAPGGTTYDSYNTTYDSWIVSTYTDNGYGYSIGTSMACPHVSGVAALILSEFGGDGFTPADLKEKLYQGAIDIDEYNTDYEGELGVGLINAAGALGEYGIAPEAVNDLEASISSNNATLTWTVSSDEDDIKAYAYTFYYAASLFTQDDIDAGSNSIESTTFYIGSNYDVGDTITKTISDLTFETTYYFAVEASDYAGTTADISPIVSETTGANSAPIITSEDGNTFVLESWETETVELTITEPDDETYTWSLTDNTGNIDTSEGDSYVKLSINALDYTDDDYADDYSTTLTVTDNSGLSSFYTVYYSILENNAPVASEDTVYYYMGDTSNSTSIDLSSYISDEDGEDLDYDLSYDVDMVSTYTNDDNLIIKSNSYGLTTINITATDARGEECEMSVIVMMRDNDSEVDVYPNPVTDTVNFRMGDDVDGDLNVKVYNSNGVLVDESTTSITTFSPASMDLSDLASGQYELKMTYDNTEMETNIVKL